MARPLAWLDRTILWALTLYGALALVFLALTPRFFLPAEDAVILFQYSRNLAQHGVIAFNVGGPHTEGATDFAWMLLVALAERCGLSPFVFTALANIASLLLIALLLLKLSRLPVRPEHLLAIAGAAALCPQIFAAASGFAVLPDAFLLIGTLYFVLRHKAVEASLFALILCLFRPDGVVFAIPLLAHLVVGGRTHQRLVAVFSFFILPGTIYFIWRRHYFGEPFPLPFLVKSNAERIAGGFVSHSVRSSLIYLAFAAVVLSPLLRLKPKRLGALLSSLLVVPTLFYWTVRLDQNVGDRFFFYIPLVASVLLATYWPQIARYHSHALRVSFAAWLILLAGPLYRESRTFRDLQFVEIKSLAKDLSTMPVHGLLATSEAGFLPYYANWQAVDVWGLNNAYFAHHFFQPSDLQAIHPDLLVFHPDRTESCLAQTDGSSSYLSRSWPHLTRNLVRAAPAPEYELWLLSYGSEFYRARKHWSYGEGDRECWFLRAGSPLHPQLATILQAHHAVPPIPARQLELAHAAAANSGKLKP